MPYIGIDLKDSITVGKLYSIHYFEYMSDFFFPGEQHDFWEFLCVDKGEVIVTAGQQKHTLRKDEMIFHQPGEFHAVQSDGETAPNLVVVSFSCGSPAMDFFRSRILRIGEEELTERLAHFVPKEKPVDGYLKRYRAQVSSASNGAVFKK